MAGKFDEVIQRWESDGFEFFGNGFLDPDDPPLCPSCDSGGFFYALWEHPGLSRDLGIDDDGVLILVPLTNALNRCYRCGYEWVDEDLPPRRSE